MVDLGLFFSFFRDDVRFAFDDLGRERSATFLAVMCSVASCGPSTAWFGTHKAFTGRLFFLGKVGSRLHNRRLLVAVLVPRVRVSVKVVALHVGLIGNPKL